MAIFEPSKDPHIDKEIKKPDAGSTPLLSSRGGSRLIKSMWKFRNSFNPEDLVSITQKFDSGIQYKGKGQLKNPKRKGSRHSKETSVVDTWVDFCSAMDSNQYHLAIPLYFYLNRLASGEN